MTTIDQPRPATGPAAAYLDAVAGALAGVPDPERQDLLDDLAEHLAELAAEDGPDLVSRLGPPERYAAELIASAGITVPEDVVPPELPSLRSRVRVAISRAWNGPTAHAVRDFLPELRPGWWVARAWAAMALLTVAVDGSDVYPVPQAVGNPFASLVALGAAIVGSVRLGRRGGRPDRLLTWIGALGVAVALANGSGTHTIVYDTVDPQGWAPGGALVAPDGRVITNIWPFDADGNVLDGVFLHDQEGRPLDVGHTGLTGAAAVPGLFPQDQVVPEYDERTGTQREVPETAPDVTLPRLPATSSSSTSSTSTTSTAPPASPPPPAPPSS